MKFETVFMYYMISYRLNTKLNRLVQLLYFSPPVQLMYFVKQSTGYFSILNAYKNNAYIRMMNLMLS